METGQPKKLLIINILNILKEYSDVKHPLNQQDIIKLLRDKYQMEANRKTIKRNLLDLLDCGFNLEYKQIPRINARGEEEILYTDWYLERDFTDAELRLLIDSILFSSHIPYHQCMNLIKKLHGLSNRYFKNRTKHIKSVPMNAPNNKQLFYNIEILDEAISRGLQVEFRYNNFGTDKRLHPRLNAEGEPRVYTINPYQMAAVNGRYYLICNYDKFDDVTHYRIDKISDIQLLATPVKTLKKLDYKLNLYQHLTHHLYMFSGDVIKITFEAESSMVSEIIDWFGMEVQFAPYGEESHLVTVYTSEQAMTYWALQYAARIKVLTPPSLVENIKAELLKAVSKYYT